MKIHAMFEEVQMTPLSDIAVIHLGGTVAFGTGKLTSLWVIEMDVKPACFNIKIDIGHLIGWLQSKRSGEKCDLVVYFVVFHWVK